MQCPGEFLRVSRESTPAEVALEFGMPGVQSIQAGAMECVPCLSPGGHSRNKWRMERINKWSGSELCSNMMEGGHIIPVSKKVIKSEEIKGA